MKFETIDYTEFSKISYKLFENSRDKNYGKMISGEKSFAFSWTSDLILPKYIQLTDNKYGIGIDLKFVIVDFDNGKILSNHLLNYYFMDFILYQNKLYLATQLEVLKIDLERYITLQDYYLPEFFNSFVINKSTLDVSCIDNQIVPIDT